MHGASRLCESVGHQQELSSEVGQEWIRGEAVRDIRGEYGHFNAHLATLILCTHMYALAELDVDSSWTFLIARFWFLDC